jgi:LAGLIDADG-like domain
VGRLPVVRRVFAWQTDTAGVFFLRIWLPFINLDPVRYEATWGTPPADIHDFDVVVGQRIAGRDQRWLDLCADPDVYAVYDIDDDLTAVDPANTVPYSIYAPLVEGTKGNIRAADLVTVPTEAFADRMRALNPNVTVLPICIPDDMPDWPDLRNPLTLTVGWAGSMFKAQDWPGIVDALTWYAVQNPDAEFHLMGADYTNGALGGRARFTGWSTVDAYYRGLDFHIGLAPLADTYFNALKCVDSSMRISTSSGMIKAADLRVGMKVWRDGWRRIEDVVPGNPRPGFQITMKGGYQLLLSPEHRMMTPAGEWLRADQMVVGDAIAMEVEQIGPRRPVVVAWPADGRLNADHDQYAFVGAVDGPRLTITPRWGRILGAFAGDGSVGQSTTLNISCDGIDQDWIDLLADDFKAIGLTPRVKPRTMYDGTLLRKQNVSVSSAHLLRVLKMLGVAKDRPNGTPIRVPCVPEVIWRSPRDVVAEFLAGYFEADGTCSASGVRVTSKSEALIRDVQRLLLGFGIQSAFTSSKQSAQNGYVGTYWNVALRRAEADVFFKEIGFRSARKTARLTTLANKPHSNAFRPTAWSKEIASIDPYTVDPIDIQVEGEVFVLAGFVSHNSRTKAIEYGSRGIPTIGSAVGEQATWIEHGVNGLLVDPGHPQQWTEHLMTLTDTNVRAAMGAAARNKARQATIGANIHLWEQAYGGGTT